MDDIFAVIGAKRIDPCFEQEVVSESDSDY